MINKVILEGNLGQDPEGLVTNSGLQIAKFSLATSEKYSKNGEQQESTEWHKIVAYDKLADNCLKYLEKGKCIYLEGKITYKKYTDQSGNEKSITEIIANEIKLINYY